ncbi:hypothetical protein P9E85_20195, partial [Bacillus subtilis]|nr:hypothetical protein [Bacillus subtilis]
HHPHPPTPPPHTHTNATRLPTKTTPQDHTNINENIYHTSYGVSPLTEGFSFAQLGELYVSSALQWHQEGNHHIETMVKDMTGEQRKSQRGSWMERNKVGFH